MVAIAVIGHSGAGKSTFASCAQAFYESRGKSVESLKLAAPLYELQQAFRSAAGVEGLAHIQDQLLMEDIASHLRRLNPRSLVDHFLDKVADSTADVIINDDLRDPHIDARVLRDHGFQLVRIVVPENVRHMRLRQRGDISTSDASAAEIHRIDVDAEIENVGTIEQFRKRIIKELEKLK